MSRDKQRKRKLAAIDDKLKRMVQDAQRLPIPSRLMSVLDQLDEGDGAQAAEPAPARRRSRG